MKAINLVMMAGVSIFSSACAANKPPNIMVFLVDDMGLMDTSLPFLPGKSGRPEKLPLNSFYKTPAMERLANQGVRFGRFYANSVCSPTRATIMTGQSSARHHTTQWIDPVKKNVGPKEWNWAGLKKTDITLPQQLKKAGYHTIHCGKAHFGPNNHEGSNPLNIGFDVNIGGKSIGRPASYYGEKNYGEGNMRQVPGLDKYHGTSTFLTEALTLEAKEAVTKAVKQKQPFYLYMSHYALHGPFNSDPRFADHYKASGKSKQMQAFATLVEGMDKSLNDLMNHFEKLGVAEDTLIIFLGDNGSDAPFGGKPTATRSSAPIKGKKGTCYEGGMRVPFIAAWAKTDPNAEVQKKFPITQGYISPEKFGSTEDIFPTVLKVAGLTPPKGYKVDGSPLLDFFENHNGKKPQHFLMHFPHPHNSSHFTTYIDGSWKVIYNYKAKGLKYELYDLANDPYESKDLAKERPEMAKTMLKKMIAALNDSDAQYFKEKGKELRPQL